MNKELFTQGEWQISTDGNDIESKFGDDDITGICAMYAYENADYDAALISQAPAMYRLLKELFNEYQKTGDISVNCLAEWLSIQSKANPQQ